MALLEVKNLKKVYTTRFGTNQVKALSDVNFSVEKGEYVAIMGESGSGKTTLLNILASLDKPTNGEILLNGKNTVQIKDKELSAFRRDNLGFVFQDFNLLDTFTIRDNIFLPLVLSGKKYNEMEERVKPLSKRLGIEQLLDKYPYEVSGGQKQRAAVARALITNPQIILADEPTLEAAGESGLIKAGGNWTNIFIYPGYRFRLVDALVTNFHLPQSTLLMLVSALSTREIMLATYDEAVRERYRFFSFGDAMFITDLNK